MTTRSHTTRRTLTASVLAAAALAIPIAVASADSTPASPSHLGHGYAGDTMASDAPAQQELYSTMRALWGQHMAWTWSTIVAFATDSPALPATLDRLLQNQVDTGNAIATFYGSAAGDQATQLLTTHINQAVPVLEAARAGDEDELAQALDDWYANAQEIADFLAAANPDHWDQAALRDMMRTHIDQTTEYASAILAGDYESAIATFDAADNHMGEMADMLSAGIIAQFPGQF